MRSWRRVSCKYYQPGHRPSKRLAGLNVEITQVSVLPILPLIHSFFGGPHSAPCLYVSQIKTPMLTSLLSSRLKNPMSYSSSWIFNDFSKVIVSKLHWFPLYPPPRPTMSWSSPSQKIILTSTFQGTTISCLNDQHALGLTNLILHFPSV